MKQSISFFQKRNLGEVLGFATSFIRQNLASLFLISFALHLPWVGLFQVFVQFFQRSTDEDNLPFFLFGLLIYLYSLSTILNYLLIYEQKRSAPLLGELARAIPISFLQLFINYTFYIALILIGYWLYTLLEKWFNNSLIITFIITIVSIYAENNFSLIAPITIYEKLYGRKVFNKSWKLVKSHWWQTFGIRLIVNLTLFSLIRFFFIELLQIILETSLLEEFSKIISSGYIYGNWAKSLFVLTLCLAGYLMYMLINTVILFAQYASLIEYEYGTTTLAQKAALIGRSSKEEDDEEDF